MSKKQNGNENEIAVIETDYALASVVTPERFKKMLIASDEKRQALLEYIGKHFEKNVHFWMGPHGNKPSLLKPGAESIVSRLTLRHEFTLDKDTVEALGLQGKGVAYVCKLFDQKGNVVGEGRGARLLVKHAGDPNSTIKMAEKSALIDAIVRTVGLSDMFTQDVEEMDLNEPKKPSYFFQSKAPAQPPVVTVKAEKKNEDKTTNFGFLKEMGRLKEVVGEQSYYCILSALRDKVGNIVPPDAAKLGFYADPGYGHANEIVNRKIQVKIWEELSNKADELEKDGKLLDDQKEEQGYV